VTTDIPEARTATTVQATVHFSFSDKKPFRHDFSPATSVGEVKAAAMAHFDVQPDPAYSYYLSHDRVRQDDTATLATVAKKAKAVSFRLVREIPQG
jgi:hypothetical protein